jgi:hypothetical protein
MWSYDAHVPIDIIVIVSLIADREVHRPLATTRMHFLRYTSHLSTVFAAA